MSWRAFCAQAAPAGGKFIFHPKEAHSRGMVDWLRRNFSDVAVLNPGWNLRCREVHTNNPHVCLFYANGHSRSVALYNATESEVEEAMAALVDYGQKHAPREASYTQIHTPTVVSYDPVNHGYGSWFTPSSVKRGDVDGRLDKLAPTSYELFDRPGQVRPQRMDKLNRGRGDDTFFPAKSAGYTQVTPTAIGI
eukprot:TRINITY_DN43936_c0_g1_i1.p1 TRINITY_DN43936_c0_g1~~TRINITY_DN43936_c0_g1_i1.p1  ORF type:complete len:193 (+),score=62.36 TRINITY_DN43936_c0_g1_i1:94-672(+)